MVKVIHFQNISFSSSTRISSRTTNIQGSFFPRVLQGLVVSLQFLIVSTTQSLEHQNSGSHVLKKLLKGVHPIIFVWNIFPHSHLIHICIHNQQLFQNSYWNSIHFWIKWELGKIFEPRVIGWFPFIFCYIFDFKLSIS